MAPFMLNIHPEEILNINLKVWKMRKAIIIIVITCFLCVLIQHQIINPQQIHM